MTDSNGTTLRRTGRKRGRPPGTTAERSRKQATRFAESDSDRPPTNDVHHSEVSKQVQKYQEALHAYEKTSALTHQLLRRLASLPALQQLSQQDPVLQQVMEVARKLMMTELELVAWALHLMRAQQTSELALHSTLLVSAFYVKSALAGEVTAVQAYLEKHNTDFMSNLGMWTQLNPRETLKFSLQEINAKWKELKRPVSEEDVPLINYNYYIDDILSAGVTPVDQFTSSCSKANWLDDIPARPVKALPIPPALSYEPTLAKECEDFSYTQLQWFEQVPVSPGLLFFGFPSPGVSALLQMEEQRFDPQTHYQSQ